MRSIGITSPFLDVELVGTPALAYPGYAYLMEEGDGDADNARFVGRIQVALTTSDRTPSSIMGILAATAWNSSNDSPALAKLSEEGCLALLRRSDDWVGACSDSKWFGGKWRRSRVMVWMFSSKR